MLLRWKIKVELSYWFVHKQRASHAGYDV